MMGPALPSLWSSLAAGPTLAWRPFLDPLPADRYWLLLIVPMVLAIATVYKAIQLDELSRLPRQAISLALQIVAFMALAAAALWMISEIV